MRPSNLNFATISIDDLDVGLLEGSGISETFRLRLVRSPNDKVLVSQVTTAVGFYVMIGVRKYWSIQCLLEKSVFENT